jgi:phage gp29-like protein
MTVLADFVLLGHQKVGSFALSSDKTELFAMAVGAYLDIICETFNNKAIPALIDLNAQHFAGITDYPTLQHGDIESADIQALAAYIKDMTGVGILVPDDHLEDYVREVAGLPERLDDSMAPKPRQPNNKPKEVNPDKEADTDDLGDLEDDEEAMKKAKERLGRYD